MQVSCSEDIASHAGPQAMAVIPKGLRQALAGEDMGRPLSREMDSSGVPTVFPYTEGNTGRVVIARRSQAPRGRRPLARVEAPCTEPGRSRCWPWPVAKVRAARNKVQP